MKVWRLTYLHDPEPGHCISWHTSKRAAERELAAVRRQARKDEEEVYGEEIDAVELKPTRKGIVQFLTHHTPQHDNG